LSSPSNIVQTPLMKQYYHIKAKHPDAILLFRVGDFYETFSEDAIRTAEILGITLTRRANGSASFIELAGFPYHALDTYLPKLVRAGQRVAICEQLEDPKLTKTIVKRGITELVTPGVSIHDQILENRENNFLASVHLAKAGAGIAFLDISTGEFLTAQGGIEYIDKLIQGFRPKEILFERSKKAYFQELFGTKIYSYPLEDWAFQEDSANDRLLKQFNTNSLKGFGISNMPYGICAAAAILHYLDLTQHDRIAHINALSRIEEDHFVWLDRFTIRNLELFESVQDQGIPFISILDKTITPMGSRLLKRWVALPLKDIQPIRDRHSIVEYFLNQDADKERIQSHLHQIGDLERLVSKISAGRINPREVNQLRTALENIPSIHSICKESSNEALLKIADQMNPLTAVKEKISQTIQDDPPALLIKGNTIRRGVNGELDELREILHSGKDYLVKLQTRESEATGIPSLKVSFNNVFGYYIEVRNTHKDKIPSNWIRKQTLVSAERYITEELKEYESKILGAEEKIFTLESSIYNELVIYLTEFIQAIQLNASLIARIDCLISFSKIACENNYCKPEVTDDFSLKIQAGRHPVIEKNLPKGENYIANDIYLDTNTQQMIIITGPNMAGKSALLRQTALITLMAQIGSFVPAESATIGLVDKIFTRVGASDNLALGESTFMVEMNEASSILNNLSSRSLILLDELGRGTSTYDGISIAWAIAEYIHDHPKFKAKTLFATHYHELNEMEKSFSRIKNYNVSVKEMNGKIIFLRKLKAGGSEHSFGIHVAQLAGMPNSVIKRANEILKELEASHEGNRTSVTPTAGLGASREGYQLSFFQLDDPVLEQIRDEISHLDINNLTPIEALNKLNEIRKLIGKKK
jgi:DNA mismatch repair protein MutS